MTMQYFENPENVVYGFDDSDPRQVELMNNLAIQNNWKNITKDFPPAPTIQQKIASYESAAQINLDSVAKSWGYDSLALAASYANSTNPQYKAEAEALIAWRDAYWKEAYTIESGTIPETAAAFVAALPAAPIKPII